MIQFITGDMFGINADLLVNTVNCVGVMGKGVALEFKNRYPDMYKEYRWKCSAGLIHPGFLSQYKATDGKTIINFPTKNHWKNSSRYSYIKDGLVSLRALLELQPLGITIAIPPLGCGNGGLDWEVVRTMIYKELDHLPNVIIYVFEPQSNKDIK